MHWEDLEGSGGEGGGRGGQDGEHMKIHGCFISMYDKIHYNIKKKNTKKNQTEMKTPIMEMKNTLEKKSTVV